MFSERELFYASDLASSAKIAGRRPIYQSGRDRFVSEIQPLMNNPELFEWVRNLPDNNAWMLGFRRYNLDLNVFEEVFTATGEDWAASIRLFRVAASAKDPYANLQSWLQSRDDDPPVDTAEAASAMDRAQTDLLLETSQGSSRGPCDVRRSNTLIHLE